MTAVESRAMLWPMRGLALCVLVACAPKPIVYLPTPPTAETPAGPPVEPQASALPRASQREEHPAAKPVLRQDFAIPTIAVALALQGTVLVWADRNGAVWAMPSDGSAPPAQLSDQHHVGFVFHPFVAGNRVLGKIDKDLVTIALPSGPVQKQHIRGISGLPEEAIGDDTFAFITLFNQNKVLKIADGAATPMLDVQRGVFALHGETLYVASYSTGNLLAVPVAGGPPRTIAKGLGRPTTLVADNHSVYVHTEADRRVIRIDVATGARDTLGDNLEHANVLALDPSSTGSVYTVSWPNKLVRLTSGGAPATVADDLEEPRAIAIDDRYVYVTTSKPPRIVRIDKLRPSPN